MASDGLGDHNYPAAKKAPESEFAVDALVRLTHENPGATLVTLGPLTNIALALARDEAFTKNVGRCVVMGGAPCCEGNATPAAEYNIWVDPEAARKVFRSELPIEMVGWHVSRGPSVLDEDEINQILRPRHGESALRHRVQQSRQRGLSCADRRAWAFARRPDRYGDRARPLDWLELEPPFGGDRMRQRTHTRHDDRRPPQRRPDDNNAKVWKAAAGESEGADTCGRSTPAGSRLC